MRSRRGLTTIEYALFIVIVVAALLGISVYLMRSLNGRWRDAGNTFGFGRQYEPGRTVEE